MFKVKSIPSQSFAEVGQKAPLRWAVCYADGKTLIGQHGWWKCKDFLNDSVVYLDTGKEFGVYGYNNKLKINDEGGYVALKHVPKFFASNVAVLNAWLKKRGFAELSLHEHDGNLGVEAVILIPTIYWKNTFLISIITSLIRACVFQEEKTVEAMMAHEDTFNNYTDKVLPLFVPENVDKMNQLLFLNYQYSGRKMLDNTYNIHNAGMQSWSNSWKNVK